MSRELPIFLTRENKLPAGLFVLAMATILYQTSNHFHLFEPVQLPLWAIERKIPFIPSTVWVYTSLYFFFPTVYLVCKDLANLNKFLYSFLAHQLAAVSIFWLWPTTYPRHLFPLPEDIDRATFAVFSALRVADTPANCCPSLHVSTVLLSSFLFLDEQREKFPFFFFWALSIAFTTLTTKQHYLVDVITGAILASLTFWIFHRKLRYRIE